MFADDTELWKSDSPSEAFTLSRTIEACISDVKVRVVQNKLQLNDDKTDILFIGSAPGIDLPSSVRALENEASLSPIPTEKGRSISMSFLPVSSHWRNRWTNSVKWLIWRSGRSVQSDSTLLLKLPELSFSLLFSLGLIIAMLSLLALLRSPW